MLPNTLLCFLHRKCKSSKVNKHNLDHVSKNFIDWVVFIDSLKLANTYRGPKLLTPM
jgi:hypothetical protein